MFLTILISLRSRSLSGSVLPIPTLPARGPEAKPTRCCVPSSLVSSNLSRTVAMPTSILSISRLSASTLASVAVDATETVL